MASSKITNPPSEEVINERNLRKRIAARVRQQRCRARKREAKLAKAQREAKAARPSMIHRQQVVRGPVLIRSPPRMSVPLLHHPTSPFIMYPSRGTSVFPPSPTGGVWGRHLQQQQHRLQNPPSPPMTSLAFPGSSRPLHQEILAGSAFGLGMTRSPIVTKPLRSAPNLHIPRVSPVAETFKKVPALPEVDLLDRKEEAAIAAMLSLHRSPSKSSEESSAFVPVGV